jgi:hypothetical protein
MLDAWEAFARFAAGSDSSCVSAGLISERHRRELPACAERLGIRQKTMLFGHADDHPLINLHRNAEFLACRRLMKVLVSRWWKPWPAAVQ